MCGIFGVYTNNLPPNWEARITSGLEALCHRGPDDQGLETFAVAQGQLALGHTRLSIIDLSPGGHQPMNSLDGRYTIVYNGEIYNYRELRRELKGLGHNFRTDSDTEVLLAAWAQWGVEGLGRLTGMFAFAVFDRVAQNLTLVRDAFGIKPFFYWGDGESLAFTSEIPALLKLLPDKPQLNLHRAYQYLVFGVYDNEADTFFQDVSHLLPGHWLQIQLDKFTVSEPRRWWWPSIRERRDLSFEEAAMQLREMFLKNVRIHLRSDVPLGAALSGGIDSSAVVCAMRHLEPDMPIHTFSYIARGSAIDEERWVDVVNDFVGAIPHKVVVSTQELGHDLDDMIRIQGEPFGGTSIYAQYRVFQLARENGIIVTLDGQGADELLAGYSGYPDAYLRSLFELGDYKIGLSFLRAWAQWPGRSYRQILTSIGSQIIPDNARNFAYRLLGRNPAPAWLNLSYLTKHGFHTRPQSHAPYGIDAKGRRLVESLRMALTGKGLTSLLRHGDRNAMCRSIESRVPFLTPDLAEFLLRLPESFLISRNGETKSVFRAAMRGIVPDVILDRRDKIGFQTPERDWLIKQTTDINKWIEAANYIPFLNAKALQKETLAIIDGQKRFTPQAWRMINYCRWVQLMNENL